MPFSSFRPAVRRCCLAAGLSLGLAAAAAAATDPVQQHNSSAVWFENWTGLSNATLVVVAPNGKITEIYAASGTPVFELDRAEAQDGVYRYELRAATEEREAIINPSDDGRGEAQRDSTAVPFYATGHFVVERGAIITPKDEQEGSSDG
ncbi:hypothetical protein [Puniceibacterium confluentis]|uniref:hypothetical protein n=1 Tax=Puniceibacterium confluentis TaxID=1958944 RepID=UPI0011B84238|nr:hypothetical protein [Puniceibacterium confluentis]